MRPRAGNTRPYGIPEPLMQSVGVDDSAARTFTEISRHRRADEDIRPYGIPEPLCISSQQPACSREISHYQREGQAPPLPYLQKVPHIL